MSAAADRARAAGAAVLLLLSGFAVGVVADRTWFSDGPTDPTALTAAAMSADLGLSPAQEERLVVLLDSLHTQVLAAVADGPEALRAATDAAHATIAASLPADMRPAFHVWMQGHREHMMHQMGIGAMPGER